MGWTYGSLSHPLPYYLRVNDDSAQPPFWSCSLFWDQETLHSNANSYFLHVSTPGCFSFFFVDLDCCYLLSSFGDLGGNNSNFWGSTFFGLKSTEILDELVFSDKIWHTPYTTKNQQNIGPKMGGFLLMLLLLNSFCWYFQIQNLIPPGKDRWRSPLPLVLGNIMAPKTRSPRNFGVASSYPSTFNAGVVFGGCTL